MELLKKKDISRKRYASICDEIVEYDLYSDCNTPPDGMICLGRGFILSIEGANGYPDKTERYFFKKSDMDTNEKLDTYEKCREYMGYEHPNFESYPEKHRKAQESHWMLVVICEAWNKMDGFVPDYDNIGQQKYYPWLEKSASGFAFRSSSYVHSLAGAGSGSRLVVQSEERARQFAEQFQELHNDWMLIKDTPDERKTKYGFIENVRCCESCLFVKYGTVHNKILCGRLGMEVKRASFCNEYVFNPK